MYRRSAITMIATPGKCEQFLRLVWIAGSIGMALAWTAVIISYCAASIDSIDYDGFSSAVSKTIRLFIYTCSMMYLVGRLHESLLTIKRLVKLNYWSLSSVGELVKINSQLSSIISELSQ